MPTWIRSIKFVNSNNFLFSSQKRLATPCAPLAQALALVCTLIFAIHLKDLSYLPCFLFNSNMFFPDFFPYPHPYAYPWSYPCPRSSNARAKLDKQSQYSLNTSKAFNRTQQKFLLVKLSHKYWPMNISHFDLQSTLKFWQK